MKRIGVFAIAIVVIILITGAYLLKDYYCYKLDYGNETKICIINTKTGKVWLVPFYSKFDKFGNVPTMSQAMIMDELSNDGKLDEFLENWIALESEKGTDSTKQSSE